MDGRETMSRPYFLNEKSNRQVLILELDSLTSLKQIFISMAHLAPSPKSHSTSRQTTKLDDEKVCCCPYLFFSHSHLFWCVSFFFFLGWRGGQYMSAVAAARREPASPRTSSSIPSPLSPLGTPIFSLFRKSQKIVNASHKRHAPTPTSTSHVNFISPPMFSSYPLTIIPSFFSAADHLITITPSLTNFPASQLPSRTMRSLTQSPWPSLSLSRARCSNGQLHTPIRTLHARHARVLVNNHPISADA